MEVPCRRCTGEQSNERSNEPRSSGHIRAPNCTHRPGAGVESMLTQSSLQQAVPRTSERSWAAARTANLCAGGRSSCCCCARSQNGSPNWGRRELGRCTCSHDRPFAHLLTSCARVEARSVGRAERGSSRVLVSFAAPTADYKASAQYCTRRLHPPAEQRGANLHRAPREPPIRYRPSTGLDANFPFRPMHHLTGNTDKQR